MTGTVLRQEETLPQLAASLEIAGLSYTYPDGRQALRSVSLRLEPGEKVALVGPNGAGKSTLLQHLNGIIESRGEVVVAGIPVTPQTAGRVRAVAGLVFQDPDDQLFSPTVFEDVAFGPLHMGLAAVEVKRRVRQALADVGLEDYAERMPHRLSLGERKRAAIATVLSMEPQLLALDEPSAGLDPRARRGLIRLLAGLPQTLLVSTHDMHMARDLFPRMVIMDAGGIVADGPTAELLADTALLEAHGLEAP